MGGERVDDGKQHLSLSVSLSEAYPSYSTDQINKLKTNKQIKIHFFFQR